MRCAHRYVPGLQLRSRSASCNSLRRVNRHRQTRPQPRSAPGRLHGKRECRQSAFWSSVADRLPSLGSTAFHASPVTVQAPALRQHATRSSSASLNTMSSCPP